MKEVALHEAKNRLSAPIAEIQESGEEVVITRHGKPAARVLPVDIVFVPARRRADRRVHRSRITGSRPSLKNGPGTP